MNQRLWELMCAAPSAYCTRISRYMCTRDIFVYIDDSSWSLLDSEAQKWMNSQTFIASTKVSNAYIQISRQIDMMNESDNYARPHAREFWKRAVAKIYEISTTCSSPCPPPPIKTDLIRLNAISILHIHARKSALYLALFIYGEYNWHKLGLLVGPREDLGQGKFPIRVWKSGTNWNCLSFWNLLHSTSEFIALAHCTMDWGRLKKDTFYFSTYF